MGNVTIGVLALQGSVSEHLSMLRQLEQVDAVEVRDITSLQRVDGLILPGGESTVIAKLLRAFGLFEPIKQRVSGGMPVWGTCAGLILLAQEVEGEQSHLGVMDITVRRNAYGRQSDSFSTLQTVEGICSQPAQLVFIRAPRIERAGEGVQVLCRYEGHVAAARQSGMLATSFHPELTGSLAFHNYFAQMVRSVKE